jgi:hypothetical protein
MPKYAPMAVRKKANSLTMSSVKRGMAVLPLSRGSLPFITNNMINRPIPKVTKGKFFLFIG